MNNLDQGKPGKSKIIARKTRRKNYEVAINPVQELFHEKSFVTSYELLFIYAL